MSEQTAVIGAGVIGASWAALFLAAGHRVAVYDPAEGAEGFVRQYVESAWPVLEQLGLTTCVDANAMSFYADPTEAVAGASFVQESVPERLPIKRALFSEIEDAIAPDAVVATSASGLTLTEMQGGWRDPARSFSGIRLIRRT